MYIVTSAETGGKTTVSTDIDRLTSHRAFQPGMAKGTAQLLRWVRVPEGFGKRFADWQRVNRDVLAEATGHVFPDEGEYICFLEPTVKAPIVRIVYAWSQGTLTSLIGVDVTVLGRPAPFARFPKSTVNVLAAKKAVIVGVGSGGSEIALQLACAGVGSITLFDGERLEPPNYSRHELTRRDLGRTKVNGLKSDLEDRELPTQVTTQFLDVVVSADAFRKTLVEQKPDLIICATDSRHSRRFVNHCAMRLGIPLVIAGILDNGRIGEILLAMFGRTACYECVRLELGAALVPPRSDERPRVPYVGGEPDDLQSATHRFDVDFVASLATRVALQILDPETFEPVPTSYVVWGREKTSHPWPFNFDLPLSVTYVSVVRRSDCPICGANPADLEGVDIDECFAAILAETDEISD